MDIEKVANYRLAAAVVHKNRIISFGTNSYKSSPFQQKYASDEFKIYLHAETAAIKNALRFVDVDFLSKCNLYVVRMKNNGAFGLSKPCVGCHRAISEFGIKNVWFTDEMGNIQLLYK